MSGSEAISPTAHYTGYVWARNGLSHPELASTEGRILFDALWPTMAVTGRLTGYSLEPYLLARHRAIDALLARAIEGGEVGQAIEVACGLSPRGWRFVNRYPDLTHVEADLARHGRPQAPRARAHGVAQRAPSRGGARRPA
jgi:O-methyltransferase involved in polyketide biosynthesis